MISLYRRCQEAGRMDAVADVDVEVHLSERESLRAALEDNERYKRQLTEQLAELEAEGKKLRSAATDTKLREERAQVLQLTLDKCAMELENTELELQVQYLKQNCEQQATSLSEQDVEIARLQALLRQHHIPFEKDGGPKSRMAAAISRHMLVSPGLKKSAQGYTPTNSNTGTPNSARARGRHFFGGTPMSGEKRGPLLRSKTSPINRSSRPSAEGPPALTGSDLADLMMADFEYAASRARPLSARSSGRRRPVGDANAGKLGNESESTSGPGRAPRTDLEQSSSSASLRPGSRQGLLTPRTKLRRDRPRSALSPGTLPTSVCILSLSAHVFPRHCEIRTNLPSFTYIYTNAHDIYIHKGASVSREDAELLALIEKTFSTPAQSKSFLQVHFKSKPAFPV